MNLETEESTSRGPFRIMLYFRLAMMALLATILAGMNMTSVFPNGETVSFVNMSLKIPWVIFGVIFVLTIIKFVFMLYTEETGSIVSFKAIFITQGARLTLWLILAAYAIFGMVEDTTNWRYLLVPAVIYLVGEVIYFLIVAHDNSDK